MFENVAPNSGPALGIQHPPAYLALVAGKNAGIALDCGVTSVIGSSTAYHTDASLKQAIEDGLVRGPRMLAASHELMTSADIASGASRTYYMQLGNMGVTRLCDGRKGVLDAVRDEIRCGAEVIKLSLSQGHNAGPGDGLVTFAPDELDVAVAAAHQRGARVRAHVATKEGILECARTGVDFVDRLVGVGDEQRRRIPHNCGLQRCVV